MLPVFAIDTTNVPAIPVIAVVAREAKDGGAEVSISVKPPLVTASEDKIPVVTAWSAVWAAPAAMPILYQLSTLVSAASSPHAVRFLIQNRSGAQERATCLLNVESEVKEPPSMI
jgi:hypothetical protein